MTDEPAVGVTGVRLRKRDASTDAQRVAVDLDLADVGVQRFEEADLDLDRAVTGAGWQEGVHGAAGGGVEQGAQQPAVDHPDWVVGRFVGGAAKHRLASVDGHEPGADQVRDRSRRQPPVDDRLQELAAGKSPRPGRKRRRVIPRDVLGARLAPVRADGALKASVRFRGGG